MRTCRSSILLFVLLHIASVHGQNLDSLRGIWSNKSTPDSLRSQASFDHALALEGQGKYDSAFVMARRALMHAVHGGLQKSKAGAFKLMANILADQGKYAEARAATRHSYALWAQLGDKTRMADNEITLGYTYILQGAYPLGLEHNLKALDLYSAAKDSAGISHAENNLSALYSMLKDDDNALLHSERALAIMTALKDPRIANALSGVAKNHANKGDYRQAITGYTECLRLFQAAGNTDGMARIWNALSSPYLALGNADSSLIAAKQCLKLSTRPYQVAQANLNAARAAKALGKWPEALHHAQLAQQATSASDALDFRATSYLELSQIHEHMGQDAKALEEYRTYVLLNDSVRNDDKTKEITRLEMTHVFDQEQLADSLANEAEKEHMTLENEARVSKEKNRRNILLLSGIGLLGLAGGLYSRLQHTRRSRAAIQKEKDVSEGLLLNILPAEVAEELKQKGYADAQHFDTATILFTDFKGFTQASEKLTPQELVQELNVCFKAFDEIVSSRGIEKIKTIGDAYMCAGGLPDPRSSATSDVVQAALAMQDFMKERKTVRDAEGKPAFEMRVGIHTGPVVAGIVGVKKFQYDIWGDTVNTASRMESSGEVGHVNISESTYLIVKDEPGLFFKSRGKVQAKGKGELEMFFVRSTNT
jgi:class 3 adenylate cyclase